MSQLSANNQTLNPVDIEHRLDNLRNEHRHLDENLNKLRHDSLVDDMHIKQLKQRKLKLKDSIRNLEANLLSAAPS